MGVIFIHAPGCPEAWTPNHVNTIFFFLAGIFFKPKPFKPFLHKSFRMLLLPFLFFYLISYPFRICMNYWDTRSWEAVRWDSIFDLFQLSARPDYLYVNVPLWFILCIFFVQLIYWGLSHFSRRVVVLLLLAIFIFDEFIQTEISTPFMINNAFHWLLYFGAGNLLEKPLFLRLGLPGWQVAVVLAAVGVMLLTAWLPAPTIIAANMLTNLHFLAYCIGALALCSFLQGKKHLGWIRFYGTNTLIVLGTHMILLTPLFRLVQKQAHGASIGTAILSSVLCALLVIPVIKCLSKYVPALVGKVA